ncbi:DNA/RNA-binding protein Alba-like [Trypanosoma melophagium]|uniref:DNA/RNA-binding protein Alba-like n=1 Tax=Trypanosoma melophagium TaxID=715481 RepID=UPI00351A4159|nr:DNA/RNA-binding protein Alba-like [Trypanosoma melophagium]
MSAESGNPAEPIRVRVAAKGRNFGYVDFTKHRLHEGGAEIIISGLGLAISDAVAVAEILKNQGLVVVKAITTSRGSIKPLAPLIDKIEIVVAKSKDFDSIYEEQQKRKSENAEKKE